VAGSEVNCVHVGRWGVDSLFFANYFVEINYGLARGGAFNRKVLELGLINGV
jgi:hypothetical protein